MHEQAMVPLQALDDAATALQGILEHPDDQEVWQDARSALPRLLKFLEETESEPPTVVWQAKPKDGSVDWFQCNHPTEHNNPEYFDYRPLVPAGNVGALREAFDESISIIEWLLEDRDLDEMDRVRINKWSQLCQKAQTAK